MSLRTLAKRVVFSRATPPALRDAFIAQVRRFRSARNPRAWAAPISPGACRICAGSMHLQIDGGHSHAAAYRSIFAQLFACHRCGHKQFLPDLNDAVLADVYAQGYWASEEEPKLYAQLYRSDHNDTADAVLASMRRHGVQPGVRLHEFGCGTGLTVHQLRKRGVEASGSDWSPIAIGFGKEQGNTHIIQENANTLGEMKGQRLDVIFTNHVLEHLPDPVAFMARLKPLMHDESIIIMRLPNGDALIDRKFGMLFDPLFYFPHHIHYFSPRSLLQCAERAGFKVLDLRATTRVVPDLLNAAQGETDPATLHARIDAAAERYETEELEIVFALGASQKKPFPSVERARTIEPPASASSGAHEFSNYVDFYRQQSPWTYGYVNSEGARSDTMIFNPVGNYHYFGHAAIGDHWLQVQRDGDRPCLRFVAPRTGRWTVEVTAAARFIGGPPVRLSVSAGQESLAQWDLQSAAPHVHTASVQLERGSALEFVAEAIADTGYQRAVCLAGLRSD